MTLQDAPHHWLRFAPVGEQRIPGDRCHHCGQWLFNFMAECHNCGHSVRMVAAALLNAADELDAAACGA
jgi:uncharacterized OB-fold protein